LEVCRVRVLCSPVAEGGAKLFTGVYVRGLVLRMLSEVSCELGELAHSRGVKPFAVRPLRPLSKPTYREGALLLKPGELYEMGFTVVGVDAGRLLSRFSSSFVIAGVEFKLVEGRVESTSFREIAEGAEEAGLVELRFRSPTRFEEKSSRLPYVLPEPVRIYGNLMQYWNHYAGGLDEGFIEWVRENVKVRMHSLHTVDVDIGKGVPQTGFLGWCKLRVLKGGEEARWVTALTKLAEYVNIGSKRSYGFGVVDAEVMKLKAESGQPEL